MGINIITMKDKQSPVRYLYKGCEDTPHVYKPNLYLLLSSIHSWKCQIGISMFCRVMAAVTLFVRVCVSVCARE